MSLEKKSGRKREGAERGARGTITIGRWSVLSLGEEKGFFFSEGVKKTTVFDGDALRTGADLS